MSFKEFIAENWEDRFVGPRQTGEEIGRAVREYLVKKRFNLQMTGDQVDYGLPGYPLIDYEYGIAVNLKKINSDYPDIQLELVTGHQNGLYTGMQHKVTGQIFRFIRIPCINVTKWNDRSRQGVQGKPGAYDFDFAKFISVFVHEFTHYIDDCREYFKHERGNGPSLKGDDFKTYFNIQTEINAYTNEFIWEFERFYGKQFGVWSVNDMIAVVMVNSPQAGTYDMWLKNMTRRNKNRVMKRFADHFEKVFKPHVNTHDLAKGADFTYEPNEVERMFLKSPKGMEMPPELRNRVTQGIKDRVKQYRKKHTKFAQFAAG